MGVELTNLHILLTYKCPLRCEHCFVFGDQHASDRFAFNQIKTILDESRRIGSVEWVYFEGGEPFLLFPLLLKSVHRARQLGFEVGVVTNGFFARSEEAAVRYLRPLQQLGVARLCVSDDLFHYKSLKETPAKRALSAASKLGLPISRVSITLPGSARFGFAESAESTPHTTLRVMFSGRAVDKLVPGPPTSGEASFNECPHAYFVEPGTAYIDPYGFVQLCHGIALGNAWETPLSALISQYKADSHPIWGPLMQGGPAELCQVHGIQQTGEYVDACHLCYTARRALLDRFPQYLAPRHVYGLSRVNKVSRRSP